jgi:hypothetical protein
MSKTKPIIRVSENFTIRKIDPKHIASRFFKGDYTNRNLPENRIRSSTTANKMGKDVGQNASSEVFCYKDKNNNYQTIYTTNHALYKYVSDTDKNKEMPILCCKYCKRGNLKKPIGLPISMEIDGPNITFFVIDSFCDFGCAYSFLKRKISESHSYRGPLYMNAEQMLYCFYYRVYPDREGKSIKEKPDWDLLRENGGPLTSKEFDSDTSEYISVPSIVLLPSKKQYTKLNLTK